jgi:multiple sugar transport system permease protein
MDEAARVDGAGYFRTFWNIVLPLSKPALATVAIFSFYATWNDFLAPLIYLNNPSKFTLALGLQAFVGAYQTVHWTWLMAASTLALIPCVTIFFISQRWFIEGAVLSGVKG